MLDHGHEVNTARGRLEGVLQILIERTESDTSEESEVDVTDLIHEGRSPSTSPRKSSSLSKLPQRKRRRLNIDKCVKHDQQTYVLKLYDRSVDLAQFSPDTSLYPVCRAWIKNQPNSLVHGTNQSSIKCEEKISEVKEENIKIEDKEEEIKSLPLPEEMPVDHDGKVIDTRIPVDLKPLVKQTSGYLMNDESVPSIQSLFQEHLTHWWGVRRKWRQAAALNETRYSESTKILKSILARP